MPRLHLLILLLLLPVAVLAAGCCTTTTTREGFFTSYLQKRSSCYSCERAFPAGQEWRGQPSKCFDCERQLARPGGGGDPFAASRTIVWGAAPPRPPA